ncbi:MAG: YkvA family protein [Candidatus Riflebacteria bacterium]|nr:YkvA family protein [Candidatus Riflebacteria bacterium]
MTENTQNQENVEAEKAGGILAKPATQAVLFVLALLYVVLPVDIIPDVVPIIGWLDDITVLLAGIINFLHYIKNKRSSVK